jgi:tetratricopeptide (TPR) repeat protein
MSERFSRKSLKHDEFVETAFDVERWFEKHWKPVAGGVAVVVTIALAAWGWTSWSHAKAERVSREVSAGIARLLPPPGSDSLPSADLAIRYPEALASFEKAAADGAGTAPGRVAGYYRGAALLRLGRAAEAVTVLEPLAAGGEDLLADLIRGKLAAAYGEKGESDKAIASWKELGGRTDSYYPRDLALYRAADLLYRAGRSDEAKKVLEEASALPPGMASEDAKRLLARITGETATPVR